MKHTYLITGGAGLIGSNLIAELNQRGETEIYIVDHLGSSEKWKNLRNLDFLDYFEKDSFYKTLEQTPESLPKFTHIVHLGACSNTTETNVSYLIQNNYEMTKLLCHYAIQKGIRFIYASSAATYGLGEFGYNEENFYNLKPLNAYGYSKHLFDLYAAKKGLLNRITGLKYFNVFGYGEFHKGDMRSVVLKGYEQIKQQGKISLFKSYNKNFKHGEQKRDFLYVKDACKITLHLLYGEHYGLFNVGRGIAETWLDLANALFMALGISPRIEFIEMPEQLKSKYQYYTCADISKLINTGYNLGFTSLNDAVKEYVSYLENQFFL